MRSGLHTISLIGILMLLHYAKGIIMINLVFLSWFEANIIY